MQHCPPRIIHQAQYTVPALITIEDKVCNEQKHLLNFMWQVQYCLSNFMFWVQLAVKKCVAVYIKRGAMVRLLIGTPRPKTDTCRHAFLSHLRSLSLSLYLSLSFLSHLRSLSPIPSPLSAVLDADLQMQRGETEWERERTESPGDPLSLHYGLSS